MKKIIMSILILVLTFSFCAVGLASDKIEEKDLTDKIEEARVNNTILVTEDSVYDYTKSQSKTFHPYQLGDKALTEGEDDKMWYADCDFHNELIGCVSEAWTESKDGSSSWSIDRIMARARLYDGGALFDSSTDNNYNASYAGCSTDNPVILWYCELYGSHACEESGYVSWYPETYDGTY